jgi:hypothetical protein
MFEKTGDVEVKSVQKACPKCGMKLIAVDQFNCDSCKAEDMTIQKPKDEDTENVLQDS